MLSVMARQFLSVIAVASSYAWEVVESAHRANFDVRSIDNFGGADERLPALVALEDYDARSEPFVIGLSSAIHRAAAARRIFDEGFDVPVSLIDPSAVVASTVTVKHGAYVNAGAVVGANTTVGGFSNINRSASIGHDNSLGFAVSIGPGAVLTSGITVGAVASIGAGAVILPGITIGRRAVVGAGAVVLRDVADFEVVVGNPSRVLRTLDVVDEDDTCPFA
jgi:sugar O-acyltransferase (sialic acid O-acetyltransferase NeuD family)